MWNFIRKTIETDCNFIIQLLQNFFLPLFNGNINNLRVLNCKNVWVTQNTFRDVDHIGHIHFTNIKELILEPHSLEFRKQLPVPKIKLIFTNVSHSLKKNCYRNQYKSLRLFSGLFQGNRSLLNRRWCR